MATVQVWLDGAKVYETPVLRAGAEPLFVCVPVYGAKALKIAFTDAGDGNGGDHVDLARIGLTSEETKPLPVLPPTVTPVAGHRRPDAAPWHGQHPPRDQVGRRRWPPATASWARCSMATRATTR